MPVLAIDTATPAISAALVEGSTLLAEAVRDGATAHGELLAPTIQDALEQAGLGAGDLDGIVVGVGPGPFTGLRVGVVTALTMADALNVTVQGVCTLDALAYDTHGDDFLVMTDARRKEVYWARYKAGRRIDGPHVAKASDVAAGHPGLVAYGRGAALYADDVTLGDGPADPRAAALALALHEGKAEAIDVEPLYLRRPDATPQTLIKQA